MVACVVCSLGSWDVCWVETGLESGIIILYSASEHGYLVLALYKHALLYYMCPSCDQHWELNSSTHLFIWQLITTHSTICLTTTTHLDRHILGQDDSVISQRSPVTVIRIWVANVIRAFHGSFQPVAIWDCLPYFSLKFAWNGEWFVKYISVQNVFQAIWVEVCISYLSSTESLHEHHRDIKSCSAPVWCWSLRCSFHTSTSQ